ncbi:MAG: PIN domain-containing protein [Deltaproteobacteria bacterium]|nr:PIN domain-containing protein [Deltaproteobacteria bacterium]
MIHLDTGFLIRALVRGTDADRDLRRWLLDGESIGIAAIAWAEFLCGPLAEREIGLAARLLPERVPFTEDDALVAARLFNLGGRRRGSLGDCMIAATAIRSGARLATTNPLDFRRFASEGLELAGT